jgi:serine/threonine protein kinase
MFHFPYAQLSAIKAILGSPPEAMRKEWLSLPKQSYVYAGEENCPSILNARMDIEFPPGTEDLKELVRNMLHYDPEKRISLQQCLHSLTLPRIRDQEIRLLRRPECPSMDFLSERRRELPAIVTGAAPMRVSVPQTTPVNQSPR